MKTRALIKYGAIAVLLGAIGFTFAIGALTLIFAPKPGAYAPMNSSDAAAWIQAIGSIAAIVAAYWLGERQARKARAHALELFHLQRVRVDDGVRGVVAQLHKEAFALKLAASQWDYAKFSDRWQQYLKAHYTAALDAFDHLPHHELGSTRRVHLGFELRGTAVATLHRISEIMDEEFDLDDALPAQEKLDRRQFEEGQRIIAIRRTAEMAYEGQTQLRDAFNATYAE
ncbi:hypothetical protein [Achromobacter insuavis]|uniref:hypothetical protein n=1 Tax=Achromobacter insuavis TaxID=1287735 RepID=UPI001F13A793|nr:hypothetical protein [Achromobacter insuavis]